MFDDEKDIIEKVLSGNTEAFAMIVRQNQTKVLGLCASILEDRTQAEDAAQEIFIKAFRSLNSFKMNSSVSTWLYRIASNHCKDLLRSRARQKTQSLDALIEKEGEAAYQKLGEMKVDASPDENVEMVLGLLSPDERMILTLREVQGLSYQEIAESLECTLDAVKARLKRARAKLQEKACAMRESL